MMVKITDSEWVSAPHVVDIKAHTGRGRVPHVTVITETTTVTLNTETYRDAVKMAERFVREVNGARR